MNYREREDKQQMPSLGTVFERLCDVCGTTEVAEVARCLGLGYTTIRNYQLGRHPQPEVLISIVEHFKKERGKTLNLTWLLMAMGPKFLEDSGLDLLKGAIIEIRTQTEAIQLTVSTEQSDDVTRTPSGQSKPDNEHLPLVTMRDERQDSQTDKGRRQRNKKVGDEQGGRNKTDT